jgi:hypothetical protein
VTPTLKVLVPKLFVPAPGELPVVAPVIAQVKVATPQLSVVVGFGVITLALQALAGAFAVILPGQVIVGGAFSMMVTVKLQVAEFPAASFAV